MSPTGLPTWAAGVAAALLRAMALLAAWPFRVAVGGRWRRRAWKGLAVLFVALVLLLPRGDVLSLSPAEWAAARYRYDLIGWEVSNLPAKWIARLVGLLPWRGNSPDERRAMLDEYLDLTAQVRDARSELDIAVAGGMAGDRDVAALQERADSLEAERGSLRDAVEEVQESAVSSVVTDQGLNVAGEFVWPPVDVRLDRTPHLLVTSPRERIERLESVLLKPHVPVRSKDAMENRLFEEENLSAVVIKTGGVATYPTVIPDDAGLERLLELAAHEWLHTHLFFHPLGQGLFRDDDMLTLNETLASMFGREVGRLAYEVLTGERLPEPPAVEEEPEADDASSFSFNRFMRETRLHTDELLEQGEIGEAERYMEDRRVELNSHGYDVRKINQAWFAFHGTYADSPASISPIAGELDGLRVLVPGIGEMVRLVRGVSSYEDFQALLAERREGAEPEAKGGSGRADAAGASRLSAPAAGAANARVYFRATPMQLWQQQNRRLSDGWRAGKLRRTGGHDAPE